MHCLIDSLGNNTHIIHMNLCFQYNKHIKNVERCHMKVYGDIKSGNCFKVKMILELCQIAHEWQHIDILKGESRTQDFLHLNPNGKIPVLHLEDGSCLAESNAILFYLAKGSSFWPEDHWVQTQILQWLFFEQYSHEPYIAVARFINKFLGLPEDKYADYLAKQEGGHKALHVMEQQLVKQPFLVGTDATLADIALYAYTHVAEEGGFDLEDYPAIRSWLARMADLPNCPEMYEAG